MKKCKATKEAIINRMKAAERLNNRNGGTYYGGGKSSGVFNIEIFGIKHTSRTGGFTMDELIKELI